MSGLKAFRLAFSAALWASRIGGRIARGTKNSSNRSCAFVWLTVFLTLLTGSLNPVWASPLYGVGSDRLYAVDVGTAAITSIGITRGNPGEAGTFMHGLAFDSGGTLYGVGSDRLYTVDVGTGAITSIGITRGNPGEAGTFMQDIAFAPAATPAIPEPETYAMMLAGLGLVGFMARRRKLKAA